MSSNDTLIIAMMAEMDALQKNHWDLEEHEAYEEAQWAEDLVAQKKAKVEEQLRALKLAEEDLAIANCAYHRIRYVPRGQRRGVNFKTKTTLDDRLDIRSKWETLNWLLKTVGKEERKLEYLDRPWWRLEKTDVPQAQVQEAPKEAKSGDGLAQMSWARLYVPPPPPPPPVVEKAEAEKVEPEAPKLTKSWPERWESWSRLHMPSPQPPAPPAPVSEVENTYVAAAADTAAPQVQEPDYTYVPPPRVLDAEQYWPASRCRNLAKEVLREKLSRNHFGLIQQLSSHYKITPEEFKKTNPFDLLKNTGILRKILNYREYSRMERARRMVI